MTLGRLAFDILSSMGSPKENALMCLAIWNEAARGTVTSKFIRTSYLRWNEAITELLREGQRTGEIRPEFNAGTLATVLSAAFDGLNVKMALEDEPPNLEETQLTLIGMVSEGIFARREGEIQHE
jgi:hypothetical protein